MHDQQLSKKGSCASCEAPDAAQDDRRTYACPVCEMKYEDEAWAKKCEAWCTEHHSCNLDIIKRAVQ